MLEYLIRRLIQSTVVIAGVLFIVFVLVRLSGDPAVLMLPPEASREQIAAFRRELGLDRPLHEQFWRFLTQAVRGDLGQSMRYPQAAIRVVTARVPATLELTAVALAFTLVVAVPFGIVAAVHRDSWVDRVSMSVSLLGQSTPTFWLGIVLILIFAVKLRWLPPFGRGDLRHLIMPGLTLGLFGAAVVARLLRSSLLEVLNREYIRTARAKGLAERTVLYRHALKNASLPVVTVLGLQIGALMGGTIITETVFAYPGLGLLAIQSISARDYPVVQAFVLVMALVVAGINLLVDVLYTVLDPRIRFD